MVCRLGPPVEQVDPGAGDGQGRTPQEGGLIERPQPPVELVGVAAVELRQEHGQDERRGQVGVAAHERMLDRGLGAVGGCIPPGCAAVKLRGQLRLPSLELLAQEVAQEVVVAVASPRPADLADELVRARQRPQPCGGSGQPDHRLGDLRLDHLEDRAPREERDVVVIEIRQDLGPQVVRDVAGLARHGVGGARRPARPPTGEGGEIDAGGPSLGPLRQRSNLLGAQRAAGGGRERLCLHEVERELVPPDLEERAPHPEPPERQARRGPPRHRHLEPGREMVEERAQRVETGPVHEAVSVIEHQQGRAPDPVQLEREARHGGREDPGPGRRDGRPHRRIDRQDPVDGGSEVGEEDAGDVVEVVEGQPRDGPDLARGPLREEQRLAGPGRGNDGDDRRPRLGRQQADEAVARDRPGARSRRVELRLDEREGGLEARKALGGRRHARRPTRRVTGGDGPGPRWGDGLTTDARNLPSARAVQGGRRSGRRGLRTAPALPRPRDRKGRSPPGRPPRRSPRPAQPWGRPR